VAAAQHDDRIPSFDADDTWGGEVKPDLGIFVRMPGDVPFIPQTNRIFVRFKDSGEVTRGSTSVAAWTSSEGCWDY
jgi:hypothetical protein